MSSHPMMLPPLVRPLLILLLGVASARSQELAARPDTEATPTLRDRLVAQSSRGVPQLKDILQAKQEVLFTINAQYRGGVTKSFEDLGEGHMAYIPMGNSRFRLDGEFSIRHPKEKDKIFQVYIDMTFEQVGDRIDVIEDLNDYNNEARGLKRRIERAVPFIYLLKFFPLDQTAGKKLQVRYRSQNYHIEYGKPSRYIEASVYEHRELVTKAFFHRDPSKKTIGNKFHKFRVPSPTKGVMLSFVMKEK